MGCDNCISELCDLEEGNVCAAAAAAVSHFLLLNQSKMFIQLCTLTKSFCSSNNWLNTILTGGGGGRGGGEMGLWIGRGGRGGGKGVGGVW